MDYRGPSYTRWRERILHPRARLFDYSLYRRVLPLALYVYYTPLLATYLISIWEFVPDNMLPAKTLIRQLREKFFLIRLLILN